MLDTYMYINRLEVPLFCIHFVVHLTYRDCHTNNPLLDYLHMLLVRHVGLPVCIQTYYLSKINSMTIDNG